MPGKVGWRRRIHGKARVWRAVPQVELRFHFQDDAVQVSGCGVRGRILVASDDRRNRFDGSLAQAIKATFVEPRRKRGETLGRLRVRLARHDVPIFLREKVVRVEHLLGTHPPEGSRGGHLGGL